VIFLRQRSTEQCNKTVPEQLADGASKGFDRVDECTSRASKKCEMKEISGPPGGYL